MTIPLRCATFCKKYEIDEVPVILIFDGNGGIQKISSQNILENFSNYLEATLKT